MIGRNACVQRRKRKKESGVYKQTVFLLLLYEYAPSSYLQLVAHIHSNHRSIYGTLNQKNCLSELLSIDYRQQAMLREGLLVSSGIFHFFSVLFFSSILLKPFPMNENDEPATLTIHRLRSLSKQNYTDKKW